MHFYRHFETPEIQVQLPGPLSNNSQENESTTHLSGASSYEYIDDSEVLQEKYYFTTCSAYKDIDICEEIPE